MNSFVWKNSKWLAGSALLAAILLPALCGCSPSTPPPAPKSNEFFATWLQSHGETNVVVDAGGVGIAGNPTRLRYSVYGSERHTNGTFGAELEFRLRVPGQREIIEYVAGSGDSMEKAEEQAKANFVITTFHAVYGSFMNTNDPHHAEEKIVIGGQPRLLVMGDTMTMGELTNSSPSMLDLRDDIRRALTPLPLSTQTHWIKIIYANRHSKTVMCAVTMDNEDSPALTEAVKNLPWPKQEKFYMAKQFIVVK